MSNFSAPTPVPASSPAQCPAVPASMPAPSPVTPASSPAQCPASADSKRSMPALPGWTRKLPSRTKPTNQDEATELCRIQSQTLRILNDAVMSAQTDLITELRASLAAERTSLKRKSDQLDLCANERARLKQRLRESAHVNTDLISASARQRRVTRELRDKLLATRLQSEVDLSDLRQEANECIHAADLERDAAMRQRTNLVSEATAGWDIHVRNFQRKVSTGGFKPEDITCQMCLETPASAPALFAFPMFTCGICCVRSSVYVNCLPCAREVKEAVDHAAANGEPTPKAALACGRCRSTASRSVVNLNRFISDFKGIVVPESDVPAELDYGKFMRAEDYTAEYKAGLANEDASSTDYGGEDSATEPESQSAAAPHPDELLRDAWDHKEQEFVPESPPRAAGPTPTRMVLRSGVAPVAALPAPMSFSPGSFLVPDSDDEDAADNEAEDLIGGHGQEY